MANEKEAGEVDLDALAGTLASHGLMHGLMPEMMDGVMPEMMDGVKHV